MSKPKQESQPNLYETGVAMSPDELDRLREFEYPSWYSINFLGPMLAGNILDAGAGSNTTLGEAVKRAGGNCTPLDINPAANEIQRLHEFNPIEASITDTHLDNKQFDLVHARIVFGHLDSTRQKQALHECLRIGREVLIIDFDWQFFKGKMLAKFISTARNFFDATNYDPDFGGQLLSWAYDNTPQPAQIQHESEIRPLGNYWHELGPLANTWANAAETLHHPSETIQQFQEIAKLGNQYKIQENDQPAPTVPTEALFVPPAIQAVRISPKDNI